MVTGSTDGIGKQVALELAARGFNMVLIARNIEKLEATQKEVRAKGVETRVIVFDFCDDTSLQAYSALTKKLAGLDVSVLVNNVGLSAMT